MGPTFDFYLGWRERNESTGLLVNDYNIDPDFSIGLMGKISKSISLTDKIFLEPEVRYSYNFTFDRTYAGFGIAAQYKFH